MSKRDSLVDLEAELVHSTAKAYLFDFGLDEDVWIPKEACEWYEDDGIVSMRENYAIEKGLV